MRNTTIVLASVVSAALLGACSSGGPARPQVKQIDYSDGSRIMMTYTGDRLDTAKSVDNKGGVASEGKATYDGGQLVTFSVGEPGQTPTAYTYSYDDSARLSKISATNGGTTYTYTVSYSEGLVSRTDLLVVSGETSNSSTTDFTYDETRKLKEQKNVTILALGFLSVTTRTTSSYTYDPATLLLKAVQATVEKGSSTLYEFTYDESSRLSRVQGGGETYTVEYGADGNISRTNYTDGNNGSFKTYTYTGGSVVGLLATPLINFGSMFDMAGRELPNDQAYVTSALMGLQ